MNSTIALQLVIGIVGAGFLVCLGLIWVAKAIEKLALRFSRLDVNVGGFTITYGDPRSAAAEARRDG